MKFGNENNIMIIGEKESFLIRVLSQKLKGEKFDSFFVKADIDAISNAWDKADGITYYLDNAEVIKPDILHFLADKLIYTNKKITLIGEKNDIDEAKRLVRDDAILGTFLRPLETDKYIALLKEYYSEGGNSGKKKNILIVDDDPTYMGVIRGWLKEEYKVSMANSGTQALTIMGSGKPDLILLDYEMPVVSGPQVLGMIRSEPELSGIPVFFLTSKGDRDSVMKVMALKPENYLLKSIEKDDLIKKLKEFFIKRKG